METQTRTGHGVVMLDAGRGETMRRSPEQLRASMYAAQKRYRAAWRNLLAGSTLMVIAIAAAVWIAALG